MSAALDRPRRLAAGDDKPPRPFYGKADGNRGERLRLALQELGPIFVKFGQAVSTRRDLLPGLTS